jgi:hypothetical protein
MKGPGWAKRDKQIDSHRHTIGWFHRHIVSKKAKRPANRRSAEEY